MCWGASFAATSWQSHLLRVEAGQVRPFEQQGMTYAEPIFVPRPQGESPSDGVILSVGCHQSEPPSALVSLDAEQVRPIAHGEVDLSLPPRLSWQLSGPLGGWAGIAPGRSRAVMARTRSLRYR